MKKRILGKTGFEISSVGLGTWQVGGKWGSGFSNDNADAILDKALENGINFIDTADVYEGGESERAVGRMVKRSNYKLFVATKCGRQISPHVNEGYTSGALRKYVEDSLKRMDLETIDLIQLHCPPTAVYYRPEIFELFKKLKEEGKIQHLGVSVEKVEEALKAVEFDNVTTVQIIYNIFRQRPQDYLFKRLAEKNIGVIVRVPLASGLLSGKFSKDSQFSATDHRFGNRNGEWFDKGETFAGIPFEIGLEAVAKLKEILPAKVPLTAIALQWVLRRQEISCVIPGASTIEQFEANVAPVNQLEIDPAIVEKIEGIYYQYIKKYVHQLW